ncbi:GGDEF domain-containing protein [Xylella fastidiosa]|nr:GGDEF domain-containing protein [Xylella fastidiosa]ALQ94487.1 diguanylate cyclase [Xylella fastidiosa]ALR01950.1 diguanylate cyclase [Xylella fastidiosa]ALR04805.1 GGDEF domain-containing protein [Xylella fastidiosa]KXB11128.1 diguanylate cyclase [Xylella fastidiosa]KXB19593.1 diguanylate cyclase [Xylella fastidiosa]
MKRQLGYFLLRGVLLWLCLAAPAVAQSLMLERLDDDPPAHEVLAGVYDAMLRPNDTGGASIYETARHPVWWRIRADRQISAAGQPKLQIEFPYLNWVEAWVPGRSVPSRHAIYGAAADRRYATRALVIDLPEGLPQGRAVWLRVHAQSTIPMPVSIVSNDVVHRRDLDHVAWYTFILGLTTVLAVLSASLWMRLREPVYGYFTVNLVCVLLYLIGFDGEARGFPVLGELFGSSPVPIRVVATFGGFVIVNFQRHYLNTAFRIPRVDLVLKGSAGWLLVMAVLNVVPQIQPYPVLTYLSLIAASLLLLFSCAWLGGVRGHRDAWSLLVAWTPLLLFSMLRSLELIGWNRLSGNGAWIGYGLSMSLALSCLLVTLVLADHMLELRRDRDRARLLANVDGLTGALTRVAIERRLERDIDDARQMGTPLSVAFIDIDHFKRINDEYGHAAGDACLRQVVQRVRGWLRASDALGRHGGDELIAILPGADLAAARRVAEGIRIAVSSQPFQFECTRLRCTLSLGVASWLPDESIEALLQRADNGLYASKAAGRDRVSTEM